MNILSLLRSKYKKFRNKNLRKKLGYCHPSASISYNNLFVKPEHIFLSEHALIQPGGRYILYKGKLKVGRWSGVAYNVTIITGNHIPTVGFPHRLASMNHINDKEHDIEIGDDCWVGANVTLLYGAKLNRGCVAAAGSLINKEIPPYAVVAGIPAKIIAVKFTKEQILKHEEQIYTENERFSEEYIDELFIKYFSDKKAIGSYPTTEQKKLFDKTYRIL